MNQAFRDYFRCPDSLVSFELTGDHPISKDPSYFRFGPDLICYGRSSLAAQSDPSASLPEAQAYTRSEPSTCTLPFDPTEVAQNLRLERYVGRMAPPAWKRLIRATYYWLRPALPVSFRRHLQRAWLRPGKEQAFPKWPVDRTVDQMFERLMQLAVEASSSRRVPFIWFWPEAKSSCAIMTHDVETDAGLRFSGELMDLNDSFGIKSSFQLIPGARYVVNGQKVAAIKARGFEVNVHDLRHDGHLFDTHDEFKVSAKRINDFAADFGSKGFRAGALYRNQEWFDLLNVDYDMSVPNMAALDPQPGGCCTVMPYFVGHVLEIPVTATQDYTLFHVLSTYSQDLWNEQIRLIREQHGLISFIVHPDYLDHAEARSAYTALLSTLAQLRAEANLWIALPGEVDTWWRQRNAMTLVADSRGAWHIQGPGAERACVAYATIEDGKLHYSLN